MKRFTCFLCLLISLYADAQDFSFSQFYEMPMLRNPALTGVFNDDGDLRVAAIHRNQWGNISVPFKTTAVGGEYKFPSSKNYNISIGLQMTSDAAGDLALKRTQVSPVVAIHRRVSENSFLTGGFMLSMVNSQFDRTNARFDDQFVNGSYSPTTQSAQVFNNYGFSYYDLSAGLVYSFIFGEDSHCYIGGAVSHLYKKVNESFLNSSTPSDILPIKYSVNAGLSFPVNETDQVITYLDYYTQASNKQFTGGLTYEKILKEGYDERDNISLTVGSFYRWNDALIPIAKMKFHEFMIGISYDVNVSKLSNVSKYQGGLELSISFLGFLGGSNASRSMVRCGGFGSSKKIGWFSTR